MKALVGLGFLGAALWLKRSGRSALGSFPLGSRYCDELDEYVLAVLELQDTGLGWQWGPSFEAGWTPEAEKEIRATASKYSANDCAVLEAHLIRADLQWEKVKATPVDVPVDGCYSQVIHQKLTTENINGTRGNHRDLKKVVRLVCP